MSEKKKYRNYTAGDIEKYHKGLLSAQEMNALEKAALDDPFLADAMEGYSAVSVNADDELSELEKKLKQRIAGAKVVSMEPRGSFKWWKVAAAVVIIGGLGLFTYRLSTRSTSNEVAKVEDKMEKKNSNEQPQLSIPANDSNKSTSPETRSIANSEKQTKTKTVATRRQADQSHALLNSTADTTNKDVAANAAVPVSIDPLKSEKYDSAGVSTGIANSREGFAKAKMPAQENRKSAAPSAMQQQELGRDQQQMNYFNGRVVDRSNNPLPFANITNAKDNAETYADAKGNFSLLSPDSTLVVHVHSVGFEPGMARLNNIAANQVVLQENKTLKEVVITGSSKAEDVRARASTIDQAEPVDGWSNYNLYLANNVNAPGKLKKKISTGEVQLSFDLNEKGNPVNLRVEKSLCKECDAEAIRVVRDGPKWRKTNNKSGRVLINIQFNTSR